MARWPFPLVSVRFSTGPAHTVLSFPFSPSSAVQSTGVPSVAVLTVMLPFQVMVASLPASTMATVLTGGLAAMRRSLTIPRIRKLICSATLSTAALMLWLAPASNV